MLQMNSSDEFRSRVMSVYALVFAGSTPLGNLIAGYVSDRFGASTAFIFSGAATFILITLINVIIKAKRKA